MVLVEVAQWYRKYLKDHQSTVPLHNNAHVSTRLYRLMRTNPEAQAFLRERLHYYRNELACVKHYAKAEEVANLHVKCAAFLEVVNIENINDDAWMKEAIQHLLAAKELDDSSDLYKIPLSRIEKKIAALEYRINIQSTSVLQQTQNYGSVKVVMEGELTYAKFIMEHAVPGVPLIIRGGAFKVSKDIKLDYLKDHSEVSKKEVLLKKVVKDSVQWAKLEDGLKLMLKEFVSGLEKGGFRDLYLHDVSIPLNFPDLLKNIQIPKYFAGDFLQRLSKGTLYRETWPSLFVGPAGTKSKTHVDSFGSNFWMALFEGRKRWLFASREDIPLLYPNWYDGSSDIVFGVEMENPNLKQTTLFERARVSECILEPGDILFVPAKTPHFVENLENSVAISANYIDSSNFDVAKAELLDESYTDSRALELLQKLERLTNHMLCRDQTDLTWEQFKSWPKSEVEYNWDVMKERVITNVDRIVQEGNATELLPPHKNLKTGISLLDEFLDDYHDEND